MPRMIALAALVLLVVGSVGAQAPETFAIWMPQDTRTNAPAGIYEIGSDARVVTIFVTLSNTYSRWAPVSIRGDNTSFLGIAYAGGSPNWNPTIGVMQCGQSPVPLYTGSPLNQIYGVARNCDGDWFVLNNPSVVSAQPTGIYRLRGRKLKFLASTKGQVFILGGVEIDEETGLLLAKGRSLSSPVGYGYFRIDPYTGAVTYYHEIKTPYSAKYNFWYSADQTLYDFVSNTAIEVFGDMTLWAQTARVTPGQGVTWLSKRWWGRGPFGLVRASQRSREAAYWVFSTASSVSGAVWDLAPIHADGTWGKSRYLMGRSYMPSSCLFRMGSRHLSWHMDLLPNGRSLHLSFPGEGGRTYVAALSLAGVRPGLALADKRVIPLNPDVLTQLSLAGGIPGVLEKTVGRLDTSGRAVVKVDLNGFGTALQGTKLWAAAVVLDPGASNGVAWIVGPTILDIRK